MATKAKTRDTEQRKSAPSVKAQPGDTLNREIIAMLQEDGRKPFAEIATALDVSEGTIRNRVAAMKQAGQLQIAAIVDPRAAAYKADAMLGIKASSGTTPEKIARRLAALDDVVYILWVSGRYDLLVEIVSDAPDALTGFLNKHIHNQRDIASVETMTGLANFKNQFLLKQDWE
jgi:Lrp/AsnC family transcriptional regulator, regulator for asnA, asnC and gidA